MCLNTSYRYLAALVVVGLTVGCWDSGSSSDDDTTVGSATAESCMSCHNGAPNNDYSGSGLENPHPFPGAATLKCTECHGGDPNGAGMADSHVPPPPQIGDEERQENNNLAYFNRLTLTGIDKFPDYTVDGVTYSAIDYLQFINPGDLRVVEEGRSCGACHMPHVTNVSRSLLATEAGVLSGALYAIGATNEIAEHRNIFEDTAADFGFRAVENPDFVFDATDIGAVGELREYPVFSRRFNDNSDSNIQNNRELYRVAGLSDDVFADGRVVTRSPLANLFAEQIAFTCGDCHLGSAGANNRTGDYRSSGCTACHMRYSTNGRSYSSDPNIVKNEPADPDDIDEPERAHVRRHQIASIHQTLATGETVMGIDDYTCAGCHQGSNRTVMQYWGIRLDQNEDVRRNRQYPSNPVDFETTQNDDRLFGFGNQEFNGRDHRQYLLEEDYDGDGRDDTPADVHYEAGLGCIDCHGSHDLHGGQVGNLEDQQIYSRMEQAVAIRCEDCHGTVDEYASTMAGQTYMGENADIGLDSAGNPMRHVTKDADGNYWLKSRLTGNMHFIKQTRDVTVDNGKLHPETGNPIYSALASFAMGRADGDSSTGLGPQQTGGVTANFSHMDNVSCVGCHASWTNNCNGCHLKGEFDGGQNFSNITGERIVFEEDRADFVYQSPVFFQLGVNSHNQIAPIASNTLVFFQYQDDQNNNSEIFTFSDRNGRGSSGSFGSLGHNVMMPHSIRGKVSTTKEGPRYCVSCHLTTDALANWGTEYDDFRSKMASNDFGNLNFSLLRTHIGQNPNNQLNSPFWVHMVSGLGSGLLLFDEFGCPSNPLDNNANRFGCNNVSPANRFDPDDVVYNTDAIVTPAGVPTGSSNHMLLNPGVGPNLRDGAPDPNMAGPLGATLIELLSDPDDGVVLDSWIDADGATGGDADDFVDP